METMRSRTKLFFIIARQFSSQRVNGGSPVVTAYKQTEADAGIAQQQLVDLHGRIHNYLRISLTERCNLRCQYCMPAEGVPLSARDSLLTREELVQLTRVFAALGVDKLRLTGGEPTLRRDLVDIVQELNTIEGIRSVSMTTNGLVLTKRLPALQRAGLAALNISLDSLRPLRYQRMARRPGLERVLAGIDLALQLGYSPVKINTVLIKDFNDDEICDFVELTRERDVEVRFIEFMPFSGNEWDSKRLVPYREALRVITARHPELAALVPQPNYTARLWQVPGYVGKVGFIASMTQHFCSSCNRLRLTADGNLKVCLFGSSEVSLRDALRQGADDRRLSDLVRMALRNKKPQHAAGALGRPWSTARRGARSASAGQRRAYCTLSHVDGTGAARMVDVGHKPVSRRRAQAECHVHVSGALLAALAHATLRKGDALAVARVAGVMAAKRTASLLPLCHALPLHAVHVHVRLPAPDERDAAGGGRIHVSCDATTDARTGVEMEALTGAAVAALTLYDMCKAVDKNMRITDLRLVHKSGGTGASSRSGADVTSSPGEIYAPATDG